MDLYDDFASDQLDAEKWQIGAVPLGDDEFWQYQDSNARVRCGQGRCEVEIPQFSLSHDQVQIFDNPKYLLMSADSWSTMNGVAVFRTTLAGRVTGDPDDYRDGFACFNVMDFATGMIFDIVTNGQHLWAIYERLLIPGQTTPEEAFTEVIRLDVGTEPLREHVVQVTYDRAGHRVHYAVDGRTCYIQYDVPVVQRLVTGFGLITLRPIADGQSTSCHGQGGTCRIGPIYVTS
jgi:hypothetical protein